MTFWSMLNQPRPDPERRDKTNLKILRAFIKTL